MENRGINVTLNARTMMNEACEVYKMKANHASLRQSGDEIRLGKA
jgi:hypothetical protein